MVAAHLFIEHHHTFCLRVLQRILTLDLASPKDIVGNDESTLPYLIEDNIIILTVLPLVAVDENKVKGVFHGRDDILCPSRVQCHPVGYAGKGEVVGAHLIELVIHLNRMELAPALKSPGEAYCRVAGIGAYLQNP